MNIAVAFLMLVSQAVPDSTAANDSLPVPTASLPHKYFAACLGEGGLGVPAAVLAGAGLLVSGFPVWAYRFDTGGWMAAAAAAGTILSFSSAAGVSVQGRLTGEASSFWASVAGASGGALAGSLVGLTVYHLSGKGYGFGAMVLTTPAGAVLGHNLGRRRPLTGVPSPRRPPGPTPRPLDLWVGAYLGELGLGVPTAALAGGCIALMGVDIWANETPGESQVLAAYTAAGVSLAFGSAAGVWWQGSRSRGAGSFWAALAGASGGTVAGGLAWMVSGSYVGMRLVLPATVLVTPIGAVIGYNLSRRNDGEWWHGNRLELPSLAVRQERLPDRSSMTVYDAKLVTVRF